MGLVQVFSRHAVTIAAACVFALFSLVFVAALLGLPDHTLSMIIGLIGLMVVIAAITTTAIVFLTRLHQQAKTPDDSRYDLLNHFTSPAVITTPEGWIEQISPRMLPLVPSMAEGDSVFNHLGADAERARDLVQRALEDRRAEGFCELAGESQTATLVKLPSGLVLWTFSNKTAPTRFPMRDSSDGTPRMVLGRKGSVLWMNGHLQQLLGGPRRNVQDIIMDPPVEHGRMATLRTANGLRDVMTIIVSRENGRREVLLTNPSAPTRKTPQPELDRLPVAILTCTPDGHLISANRAARLLIFGAGADEVQKPMPSHLSGLLEGLGKSMSDWMQQVCVGKSAGQTEFMRLLDQETERYVQVTIAPSLDDPRSPRVMVILQDATDLKTLEAKFAQTQKMQAIGQLAGGVAHDFNNLLTAISGHCDLLLLRHEPSDPEYADLIQISQNSNRAAALVSQLLAFSRKQTLNPETLNISATLSDLTHLLNRLVGEKVTLVWSYDNDADYVRVDKRQLEQVLINLVVNARDAMPDGGDIRISAGTQRLEQLTIRDRAKIAPGDYVTISVEDQGTGIPFEHQQKVFEPFFTSKKAGEGTGLGLSTVYGIVKQSGGYVFLNSAPGEGTRFDLMFPAVTETVQIQAEPAAEPTRIRHGDARVLLVEDEAPVRAFAARALQMRGYEVIESASGEEAIARFEDPEFEVDVVVTDVIMPGKDGPTWVAEAMKKRPELRVIFVSGYAEETFEEAKKMVANSVFLPKPFTLADLTATVQQQLGDAA